MVICICASKKMRAKFFQNKLYLQIFRDNQTTRAVRVSDYSPAKALSEEKDKLV